MARTLLLLAFVMAATASGVSACPTGYYEDALTHACFPYNPTTPLSDLGNSVGSRLGDLNTSLSNGTNDVFHGRAPSPAKVDVPVVGRVCVPWC